MLTDARGNFLSHAGISRLAVTCWDADSQPLDELGTGGRVLRGITPDIGHSCDGRGGRAAPGEVSLVSTQGEKRWIYGHSSIQHLHSTIRNEQPSRQMIEALLSDIDDIHVVATAESGTAAVELIRSTRPDLVFLDVQLPELDAFDVLDEVGPADLPRIVFVTAHDEFAVRAFEVNAVDYLLKPIDDRKLHRAIERVRRDRGGEVDESID